MSLGFGVGSSIRGAYARSTDSGNSIDWRVGSICEPGVPVPARHQRSNESAIVKIFVMPPRRFLPLNTVQSFADDKQTQNGANECDQYAGA